MERLHQVVDLILLVALLTQEVAVCHVEVLLTLLLLQRTDGAAPRRRWIMRWLDAARGTRR